MQWRAFAEMQSFLTFFAIDNWQTTKVVFSGTKLKKKRLKNLLDGVFKICYSQWLPSYGWIMDFELLLDSQTHRLCRRWRNTILYFNGYFSIPLHFFFLRSKTRFHMLLFCCFFLIIRCILNKSEKLTNFKRKVHNLFIFCWEIRKY